MCIRCTPAPCCRWRSASNRMTKTRCTCSPSACVCSSFSMKTVWVAASSLTPTAIRHRKVSSRFPRNSCRSASGTTCRSTRNRVPANTATSSEFFVCAGARCINTLSAFTGITAQCVHPARQERTITMTAKPQLPPVPNDNKFRQALGLGIGIWDYMDKNQREFGDTFTLTLPGQGPMVWTSNQQMIKDILNLKEEQVDASLVQLPMDLGEQNTVFLNEKAHQEDRKLVIPSFNTTRLKARAGVMHDIVTEHIDSWKPGDTFNTPRLIGDITLDVICYTLFNLRHGERKERYKYLMLHWMLEATSDTMFTMAQMVGARRFRHWMHNKYLKRTAARKPGNGKKGLLPWKRAVDLK